MTKIKKAILTKKRNLLKKIIKKFKIPIKTRPRNFGFHNGKIEVCVFDKGMTFWEGVYKGNVERMEDVIIHEFAHYIASNKMKKYTNYGLDGLDVENKIYSELNNIYKEILAKLVQAKLISMFTCDVKIWEPIDVGACYWWIILNNDKLKKEYTSCKTKKEKMLYFDFIDLSPSDKTILLIDKIILIDNFINELIYNAMINN